MGHLIQGVTNTGNPPQLAEVLEQVLRSEAIILGSLQNVFKCTARAGPSPVPATPEMSMVEKQWCGPRRRQWTLDT